MQEEQVEQCELVIVGAGLAALHLVSRLPESLLQARWAGQSCAFGTCRGCNGTSSGRAACAALSQRLHFHTLQGTVVVDSRGAWLAGWTDRCGRLAAPHVRTPVTQHPHASPLALQAYAEKHGRQEVRSGQARAPHVRLASRGRIECRSLAADWRM